MQGNEVMHYDSNALWFECYVSDNFRPFLADAVQDKEIGNFVHKMARLERAELSFVEDQLGVNHNHIPEDAEGRLRARALWGGVLIISLTGLDVFFLFFSEPQLSKVTR